MSLIHEIPPQCSPDLSFSPHENGPGQIIRNNRKRTYFRMGVHESFLLVRFDGTQSYGDIAESFEREFKEPITCDDIHDFVGLAEKEGLLGVSKRRAAESGFSFKKIFRRAIRGIKKQNLLYFRVKLIDPNNLLNWLEPKTRWLFSGWLFLAACIGAMVAIGCSWVYRTELLTTIIAQFDLRAFFVLWLTTVIVTVLHEFGHGLACKRYGGDVHEMGALWIFFTPCLYCNVSDAWLIPSRWRRLLVSMAGTYVDLLIWILAVFTWRIADPQTWIYFVAWIVISSCGVRLIFNLNPLMRLDGYYALSDFLRLPNLRTRARNRMMEFVRSVFWGAAWPKPIEDGKQLLAYGLASWAFAVGLLGFMSFQLSTWLGQFMGIGGILVAGSFFLIVTKSLFRGSLGQEFKTMFRKRFARVLIFAALVGAAMFIPVHDRAGGEFLVKPVVHADVCASIAGFLREVYPMEGEQIGAGTVVAMIEVPELSNQISRKQAETTEVKAELRRLTTGARAEDIEEQQAKINRAIAWRDLGQLTLERARVALVKELQTLDFRIDQARTEMEYRQMTYTKARQLFDKAGMAEQQLMSTKRLADDAVSQLHVAESTKRTREAQGVVEAETELARREKELADEKAILRLLEAGSRVEDIEAVQARLNRLEEEMRILREQESKQTVICPVNGTMVTARLRDRVGQYFERGAVIMVVEDLNQLEAAISIPEQNVQFVVAGQPISLKPRLLPNHTLAGTVLRIAPGVEQTVPTSGTTLNVYCRFENDDGLMRPGMTGFGRIYLGELNLGQWIYSRGTRLLRTEFWW